MSNGVRAARSIVAGEPSPDVLFSRKPSIKGSTTRKVANKTTLTSKTKPTSTNNSKPSNINNATSTTAPPTKIQSHPKKNDLKLLKKNTVLPPSLPQSPRSPATSSCNCTCSCLNCTSRNSNSGSPSTADGKIQLAEIAKLRAELSASKKKENALREKNGILEALVKKEQTQLYMR